MWHPDKGLFSRIETLLIIQSGLYSVRGAAEPDPGRATGFSSRMTWVQVLSAAFTVDL